MPHACSLRLPSVRRVVNDYLGLACLGLIGLAGGCQPADEPAFGTALIYDPLAKAPDAWPDDFWTVDDQKGSDRAGLRLHIVPGENLAPTDSVMRYRRIFDDLSRLDGFGTTAALFVRFTGPIDENGLPDGAGVRGDEPGAKVVLMDLDSTPPALVDIVVSVIREDEGDPSTMLHIAPLLPLRDRRHYGLALTTRLRDPGGAPVRPSPVMRQLLAGTASDPALSRLVPRYQGLLQKLTAAGVIERQEDLAGALVFTTQHTLSDSTAIARDIRGRKIAYRPGACRDSANAQYRICDGKMAASDYRVAEGFVDEEKLGPQAPYELPVVTYLPRGRTPPYPTVIYGHGLNGDRTQAERLAELAAPRGYATVAIDSVKHGDHPDQARTLAAIDFFGISTQGSDIIDTRKLRDNFRQSTYDKLQLVEMLRPGVDVDGDGKADVDLDRLTYLGVSLGGIMAAEFLAFVPEVRVAMPIVPGARVTDIVRDGELFAPAIVAIAGPATPGEIARFFTFLQTAIDRGDAGVYAPHIVRERLPGFDAQRPQLLMQMVINDDTVPNSTNRFYARALGAPHVGDELQRIGTIPHQQALPMSRNVDPEHTAGVFQYDLVFDGDGPKTRAATHGNVAANPLTIQQTLRFIESGLRDGAAEIIDPYRVLGVKK